MVETPQDSNDHEMYLFQYLVVMFQNLAMQQMGKLINPITGNLERDLQQARITIDMIQMIKEKTAGNLHEEEKRLIDQVLLDLQMNYVDEAQRGEEEPVEEETAEGSGETESAVSGETGTEPPVTAAASGDAGEGSKGTTKKESPAPKKRKTKKTAKGSKAGRRKKKDD